ncbi:hypothetical protein [Burkholderia sp. AU15512]|uniref:hypothetical protein n=1 Tax=Burkholderia sp. AU15512 TaxID=2015345 RepID=UPI0015C5B122|nr:hypothetical protein [Burkholderia sp. AU15512]
MQPGFGFITASINRANGRIACITHLRGKQQNRRRRNQLAEVSRALHGRHVGAGAGRGIVAGSDPVANIRKPN